MTPARTYIIAAASPSTSFAKNRPISPEQEIANLQALIADLTISPGPACAIR